SSVPACHPCWRCGYGDFSWSPPPARVLACARHPGRQQAAVLARRGGQALLIARALSGAVLGIDAYLVSVEADVANGVPKFFTVGLAQGAVREGKERVISAIKSSGFLLPPRRITVNLAPADVRKEGSAFDLPIAIGIIAATRQ